MSATKIVKFWKSLTFAALVATAFTSTAKAVQIEGFTPSGNFMTVGLDNSGRLLVDTASGGAATLVVFVTTQPVTAFQGTTPWIVAPNGGSTWSVAPAAGAVFDITENPFTTFTNSQTTVGTGSSSHIVSTSGSRVSTLICNLDTTNSIFLGPTSGVTSSTGSPVFPQRCYSPDVPGTFQGDLFAIASGGSVVTSVSLGSP